MSPFVYQLNLFDDCADRIRVFSGSELLFQTLNSHPATNAHSVEVALAVAVDELQSLSGRFADLYQLVREDLQETSDEDGDEPEACSYEAALEAATAAIELLVAHWPTLDTMQCT